MTSVGGIIGDEESHYARNKFGSQKGISSDEFFGREGYDPAAKAEARARLQGFEGSTSISSNAYFGRPEDDGLGDDSGNYGDLEETARNLIRKLGITAGDDLGNVTEALGAGANRLQGKEAGGFFFFSKFLLVAKMWKPFY